MPVGHERSSVSPLDQFLALAEWSGQMSTMGSLLLVGRRQREGLGCMPRHSRIEGFLKSFANLWVDFLGTRDLPDSRLQVGDQFGGDDGKTALDHESVR